MDKQAAEQARAALRVLKQVDTLKRQVAVLTDGSAQRRLKHLEKWQVWAQGRAAFLPVIDIGPPGEYETWLNNNPEPKFPGDDDAGGASGGEG